MRRLLIYQDGKRIVLDRLMIQELGNPIVEEINLDHLSQEDFEALRNNPHNNEFLARARKVK